MSVQVMAWVMEHTPDELNGTEQSIALALANYATNEGGHAYPSIAQLCRITRWSERTVRNALRSLEKHGVIAIEREATNKLPTMYRFVAFRGANTAPQEKSRGASRSARGASNDQWGGSTCPLSVSEPSEEPSEPLAPSQARKPYTQAFESFWTKYPRTNGTKRTAFGAWSRLSKADQAAATAGLDKWIASQHWREGYVVYAERFLARRMWEDEPTAKGGSNGHGTLSAEDVAELQRINAQYGYQGVMEEIPRR